MSGQRFGLAEAGPVPDLKEQIPWMEIGLRPR